MKVKFKTPLLLGLFVILVQGCGKDYVTGKSSYNWFSLDTDVQLGSQVLESQTKAFQKQGVAIDSEKNRQMRERIQKIVDRISKVSHIPTLPYEVHVADAPVVNAWAAPGGKVMVYEGLWDPKKGLVNQESDQEIAAVLGHEIAHCTARHVTESMSKNMTIGLVGAAVATAISAGGSAQGADLFQNIFSEGMNLYLPSYSRKNESEADKIGLFYMAQAGYDPRAAVKLWRRASQRRGDKTSIYASHPASGARADALEQLLPEALKIYEANQEKQ